MADLATLQTRLIEAEAAYHALMTGARDVEVAFSDGKRTRYSEANAADLKRYIEDLKGQIVAVQNSTPRYSPIGFGF